MSDKDGLTICPRCGGNACYKQRIEHEGNVVETRMDMGCGFTTSTLMKKGSKVVADAVATQPELYKDLMFEDKEGFIWLPAVITLPEKGMVFASGTSAKDWHWTAARMIPLQENDIKVDPSQTHKVDMKNAKHFKEKDFMDAMEYIGAFEN